MNLGELLEKMLDNKTITMDMRIGLDTQGTRLYMRHLYTEKVGLTNYLIFGDGNCLNRQSTGEVADNGLVTISMTEDDARIMMNTYHDDIEDGDYSDRYLDTAYKAVRQIRTQLGIALDEYEDEER